VVTVTASDPLCPLASRTVIVHVPALTAVTINTDEELPLGAMVAMLLQLDASVVKLPLYPVSAAVTVCVCATPMILTEDGEKVTLPGVELGCDVGVGV
jgi:hypothetical protein